MHVAYHEEDLLVDTFNETSFIWQDVGSCFLITPHTFQNLDIAAADVEASLCPIVQSRPAPRCCCCILPAIHTSIPTLHLSLSLSPLLTKKNTAKTKQNNINTTPSQAHSLTHSLNPALANLRLLRFCFFSDWFSPSSPARAAARTRRRCGTPLACSLLRYSSISSIAYSSISLRYLFIHSSLSPLLVSSFTIMERNRPVPPTLTIPDFVTVFLPGPVPDRNCRFSPPLIRISTLFSTVSWQYKWLTIPEEGNNNTN